MEKEKPSSDIQEDDRYHDKLADMEESMFGVADQLDDQPAAKQTVPLSSMTVGLQIKRITQRIRQGIGSSFDGPEIPCPNHCRKRKLSYHGILGNGGVTNDSISSNFEHSHHESPVTVDILQIWT